MGRLAYRDLGRVHHAHTRLLLYRKARKEQGHGAKNHYLLSRRSNIVFRDHDPICVLRKALSFQYARNGGA